MFRKKFKLNRNNFVPKLDPIIEVEKVELQLVEVENERELNKSLIDISEEQIKLNIAKLYPNSRPNISIIGGYLVEKIRDSILNNEDIINKYNVNFFLAKTISEFNRNQYIEIFNELKISLVILLLGSKDIWLNPNNLNKVKSDYIQLVNFIKSIHPKAKVVLGQVENKFTTSNNLQNVYSNLKLYNHNSERFNTFLKFQARNKLANRLFIIRGNKQLTDRKYYKSSGLELNNIGIDRLVNLLIEFVDKIKVCTNIPKGIPPMLVICGREEYCVNCKI